MIKLKKFWRQTKDGNDNMKDHIMKFTKYFLGSEIEIILKSTHKADHVSGDEMSSTENPMYIKGFLLDMDEEFLYLGQTKDFVTNFVHVSEMVGGGIAKTEEEKEFEVDDFETTGSMN